MDRICDVVAPRSCPRKWGPELNGFARKPASFSDSFWNWEGGHTRTDFFQRSAYNNFSANELALATVQSFEQRNGIHYMLTWQSLIKLGMIKCWHPMEQIISCDVPLIPSALAALLQCSWNPRYDWFITVCAYAWGTKFRVSWASAADGWFFSWFPFPSFSFPHSDLYLHVLLDSYIGVIFSTYRYALTSWFYPAHFWAYARTRTPAHVYPAHTHAHTFPRPVDSSAILLLLFLSKKKKNKLSIGFWSWVILCLSCI